MKNRMLTWGVFAVLAISPAGPLVAQRPISNLSLGAGFAYNGSGPMGSVVLIPVSLRDGRGVDIGFGVGGWLGRFSNDAFESSNRLMLGIGVRLELRAPAPSQPVSGFLRLAADIAKSTVSSANFVPEPPLPGDPWDRTNGDGAGFGLEGGIAIRLASTTHLQFSGGYDRQWIYRNAPNNMWRFGIGIGKSSSR